MVLCKCYCLVQYLSIVKYLVQFFLVYFFVAAADAQQDFVLLKKNGYTINRFYAGKPISIYTKNNILYKGFVDKCKHDSIFIKVGYTGLVAAGFGSKLDTIIVGYVAVPIHDISLIPAKKISAADVGNVVFKMGFIAAGLSVVNQFNINEPLIYLVQFTSAIAINIGAGFIKPFHKKRPKGYVIGKKYTLEYIDLSLPK